MKKILVLVTLMIVGALFFNCFVLAGNIVKQDLPNEYCTINNDFRAELINLFKIGVDQIPLEVIFNWDILEEDNQVYILFSLEVLNETSNIDRIEFYINDGLYQEAVGDGPTYEFVINWFKSIKWCTFTFIIYDDVGYNIKIELRPIQVLLIGRIKNLTTFNTLNYLYVFNSVNLKILQFRPFSYGIYNSGEKLAVVSPRCKIITNKFIFGFSRILFGKVTENYPMF